MSAGTRSQSAGDGLRGVVGDLDELDQSAEPDDVAMSAGVLEQRRTVPTDEYRKSGHVGPGDGSAFEVEELAMAGNDFASHEACDDLDDLDEV